MKKGVLSLGIDLGGTKILAVVADSDFKVLSSAKSPTAIVANPEEIAAQIINTGKNALESAGLDWKDIGEIGVAVPSPVDPVTGDCHHSPNLGLKNYSLKEHFRDMLRKDVYLENDGNCGILGEFYCGAAKGCSSAAAFFVGTGLGGGIIVNGKLLKGNGGIAAEFGHMIIKYGGRMCNCGNRGCVEAYSSKAGFVKAFRKRILDMGEESSITPHIDWKNSKIKSKFLASSYKNGDKVVCEVLNKGMKMLGSAAATVSAAIAPESIIIGGGVMNAMGNELFPVFEKSFRKNLFGIDPSRIILKLSELKDYSVALGATVLASKKGKV